MEPQLSLFAGYEADGTTPGESRINTSALTPKDGRSPFLPGTYIQYAWDSTSLGYLKTCPRLYQYQMIEGWGGREESVHLTFGILYHNALQNYDLFRTDGLAHDDALAEALRQLLIESMDFDPDQTERAGKYKNRWSLVRTVIDYLDKFADDPAKTYVLENGKPAVELSFRFELDWGPRASLSPQYTEDYGDPECIGQTYTQSYILCGHLDRVVEFSGELFVMDHKTTTSTPGPYYFNQYAPNNQMTLYTIASQVVLEAPVKGVIIGAAQLLIDESRFVRGFTFRTQDQLNEWLNDLHYWFATAEQFATAGYWPMNDTACDKFGGCRFREICSKSPGVRETFLKSNFTQLPPEERWNPLRAR